MWKSVFRFWEKKNEVTLTMYSFNKQMLTEFKLNNLTMLVVLRKT